MAVLGWTLLVVGVLIAAALFWYARQAGERGAVRGSTASPTESEGAPGEGENLAPRLAGYLRDLLHAHDTAASIEGPFVRVTEADLLARFVLLDERPGLVQLGVEAQVPGGDWLADSWLGVGEDLEVSIPEGLAAFCASDFHVLLAGLWGLLETDQVDHYEEDLPSGRWDVYVGPWVSRWIEQARLAVPGDAWEVIRATLVKLLTERRHHWARLFVGGNGEQTAFEALWDGHPDSRLETLLRSMDWALPDAGYASQRLFVLAVPNEGTPAHRRVGHCT